MCVELIVLICYCTLCCLHTWEGLARVVVRSLSLKECLSVFKPVQHAAQPSPLKRHTDAQQRPRGIPQAHAENKNNKKTFRDKNAHLHPCILIRF